MSQHKLGMSSFGGQLAPGPSSTSLAPQHTGAYAPGRSDLGTSFVMGGSPKGGATSSKKETRGYDKCGYDCGREEGSPSKSVGEYSEPRGPSLARSILGGKGQRVLLGMFLYGFALIAIVYFIVVIFGASPEVEYYSRPAGFNDSVRPLWDR